MQERIRDRIVLVGTAHVSAKSVAEVEEVIRAERPSKVLVELDARRLAGLRDPDALAKMDIVQLVKSGKHIPLMLQLYLANQQARFGEETGVTPGAELLRAIELAEELDIPVELIDRDLRITLGRLTGRLGFWRRITLLSHFITASFSKQPAKNIDDILETDSISEMISELGSNFPEAQEVIIFERDRYMASAIRAEAELGKVVAVVGAGHLAGIRHHIESNIGPNREFLNRMPRKRVRWGVVFAGTLSALVIAAFITIFAQGGFAALKEAGIYWIIANGGLSALGTALAAGHPIAVAVAFFAAPLTSLSPALAAGWFAGLAQAKLRPPRGEDLLGLRHIHGIRDIYGNRALRILLVVILANLGSSVGTFLGLGELVRQIGGT